MKGHTTAFKLFLNLVRYETEFYVLVSTFSHLPSVDVIDTPLNLNPYTSFITLWLSIMSYPLFSSLSTVQVEVNFENPVVFAGQPVNVILTFKNPTQGTSSPDNSTQADLNPNSPSTSNESLQNAETPLPPRTRLSRAMSARSTAPFLGPHHGVLQDKSILSPPVDTPKQAAPGSDSAQTESPSSQNEQPSPTLSTGSWDLPGRKLSSHLANSIRELYWNTSSTPDVSTSSEKPSSIPLTGREVKSETPFYQASSISRWGSQGSRPQHKVTRSSITFARSQLSQTTTGMLMGYAQLQGYFVVDKDLIDPNEFSHVKTQGVVVRPNGGIGYSSQSGAGLLQGLTSGIGSLLKVRDGEVNSSSEFLSRIPGRSGTPVMGSKGPDNESFPVFSTPQSLLFVDLKLNPGESRSFSYKMELPKSLPPSCRAKSLSIHYNLVIGIQKLDSRGRPQPKTTLIPFRVFPHVDKYGQQYTHDLRTPIVLQKDQATVIQVPPDRFTTLEQITKYVASKNPKQMAICTYEEDKKKFDSYLRDLLSGDSVTKSQLLLQQRNDDKTRVRRFSTSQDNIEYFSRYQHTLHPKHALRSSFEIGRSGKRIAAVILSKPVYRVGDNIVVIVDYTKGALKTFHITASLETEESIQTEILNKKYKGQQYELHAPVDTSAMTRRVYSQSAMSTYSLSRSTFEFTIPATATPQFSTSEIALKWSLKLDFVTSPSADAPSARSEKLDEDHELVPAAYAPNQESSLVRGGPNMAPLAEPQKKIPRHRRSLSSNSQRTARFPHDSRSLLKVAHISEQGLVAGAKETLPCEVFNCRIPLTVLPTNQDITGLLEHTVSATRIVAM